MNLITPMEVLKYSTCGKNYPTTHFCTLIPHVEEAFVFECLTEDVYEYMINSLADVPTGVQPWQSGTVYNVGDMVISLDCIMISLTNNNMTDPLLDTGDWEPFERFTTQGANDLWVKYLRFILAEKVYVRSLTPTTLRAGKNGVEVKIGGPQTGDWRSGNKSELSDVKNDATSTINMVIAGMQRWLRRYGKDAGLPVQTPDTCTTDKCQPIKRGRRTHFKY